MRNYLVLSISLLSCSLIQCSQIEEGSIVHKALQDRDFYAVTGRILAERHAWWRCKYNKGPIPEFSPNQLGQDDIRHRGTPIPDEDYDTLFVPAALDIFNGYPIVTIHGPEQRDRTHWINAKNFSSTLRYASGSRKNPIIIEQ